MDHHRDLVEAQLRERFDEAFPNSINVQLSQRTPLYDLGKKTWGKLGDKFRGAYRARFALEKVQDVSQHSWSHCSKCDIDEFGDLLCTGADGWNARGEGSLQDSNRVTE